MQGYMEEAAAEKFGDLDIYTTSFRPMRNTISGSPLRTFMKVGTEGEQRNSGKNRVADNPTDRTLAVYGYITRRAGGIWRVS